MIRDGGHWWWDLVITNRFENVLKLVPKRKFSELRWVLPSNNNWRFQVRHFACRRITTSVRWDHSSHHRGRLSLTTPISAQPTIWRPITTILNLKQPMSNREIPDWADVNPGICGLENEEWSRNSGSRDCNPYFLRWHFSWIRHWPSSSRRLNLLPTDLGWRSILAWLPDRSSATYF